MTIKRPAWIVSQGDLQTGYLFFGPFDSHYEADVYCIQAGYNAEVIALEDTPEQLQPLERGDVGAPKHGED